MVEMGERLVYVLTLGSTPSVVLGTTLDKEMADKEWAYYSSLGLNVLLSYHTLDQFSRMSVEFKRAKDF